ncbi:uncharacterized protein LOC141674757 [Apium graveolens]|uniref:uncharacterized protein LOC141674757 n=1 Tax=Apium graveolens TaxID=4045 RepID=UPI003D79AD5B
MAETSKVKDGMIGLSYPMLNRGNYTVWSIKMKVYLQAQGVWHAVEADSTTPDEEKTDKMAMEAIYQSIPEDILLSVAEKKTTKETWVAVKTMCLGTDKVKKARVQTLKAEFESQLSMKETEVIDDFCMKLNSLVTNIRVLGEEMQEAYIVKKLLRAVPGKFLQIDSTIEQFGDLDTITVEETVGSLKAHEERLRGQSDTSGGQLLLRAEEWSKKEIDETKLFLTREEWLKRSGNGGTQGSTSSRGRNGRDFTRGTRDKSKVRCFSCLGYEHYAAECKKIKREREQKEEANLARMDDEPALLMAEKVLLVDEGKVSPRLNQVSKEKQGDSNVWYLDNGASNHMTGQLSKFKHNIISLGQLAEEGDRVVLNGEYLWVYEREGKLIMKVKRSTNRLYKIIIYSESADCLLAKTSENSWLWHTGLGHVNFKALTLMSTGRMAYGIPEIKVQNEVCRWCLMSKQNGVVESRNRTVVEMARSFLKDKNMPSTFWAEAVRYSVYILNCLPTRALSGVIPYEAWAERKPDISHVRVFGCLAHMKLPANQVTKLSDRSKMMINLGKEPKTKAYRLYDPENKSVHVSRDVVFEEEKGWDSWGKIETTVGEHQGSFSVCNLQTEEDRVETEGFDTPPPSRQLNNGEADYSMSTQGTTSSGHGSPITRDSILSSDSEASSELPRKTR